MRPKFAHQKDDKTRQKGPIVKRISHSNHDFPRVSAVALAALVAALFCGCAGPSQNASVYAPPPADASRPLAVGEYVLQPGDTLAINFMYFPRFNITVTIRPDGCISLAPIDEVRAGGHTVQELDAKLTALAAERIENPDLTITVTSLADQKVYIGGQVRRGGLLVLERDMTALEAIMNAGGALDTADLQTVIVIRKAKDGSRQVFAADLRSDLRGGAIHNDPYLRPYDVVYVPKTRIAEMNQFVDQYIEKLIPVDFIATAGFSYVKDADAGQNVNIGFGQ